MSKEDNIKGNIQLPNPPIATGITKKKIIKMAWAVTIALYNWSFPSILPEIPNSNRIRNDHLAPKTPDHNPNIK